MDLLVYVTKSRSCGKTEEKSVLCEVVPLHVGLREHSNCVSTQTVLSARTAILMSFGYNVIRLLNPPHGKIMYGTWAALFCGRCV